MPNAFLHQCSQQPFTGKVPFTMQIRTANEVKGKTAMKTCLHVVLQFPAIPIDPAPCDLQSHCGYCISCLMLNSYAQYHLLVQISCRFVLDQCLVRSVITTATKNLFSSSFLSVFLLSLIHYTTLHNNRPTTATQCKIRIVHCHIHIHNQFHSCIHMYMYKISHDVQ